MTKSSSCVCPSVRQIVRWRNRSKVEKSEFSDSCGKLKCQLNNVNQTNKPNYVQLLADEID